MILKRKKKKNSAGSGVGVVFFSFSFFFLFHFSCLCYSIGGFVCLEEGRTIQDGHGHGWTDGCIHGRLHTYLPPLQGKLDKGQVWPKRGREIGLNHGIGFGLESADNNSKINSNSMVHRYGIRGGKMHTQHVRLEVQAVVMMPWRSGTGWMARIGTWHLELGTWNLIPNPNDSTKSNCKTTCGMHLTIPLTGKVL